MKNLLAILCLLLPFASLAQSSPTPFKGANVIIVTLLDSAGAWRSAGQALAAKGFAIATSSPELKTISTNPTPVGEGGQVSVAALVKGKTIEMRGTIAVPMLSRSLYPMEFKGSSGNTNMRAWRKVTEVAQAIPGATLSYRRD